MLPPRPSIADRIPAWAWSALIFGVTLACYWPSLQGKVLWDDPAHLTRPDLRSWAGLGRIWTELGATQEFYPVLHGAFWLEHRLWGDSLVGYHLLNIALHAGSCCLLALVVRRLWTVAPSSAAAAGLTAPSGIPASTAWFAALLFAVHPVCVESVAWITEQKNTLSLFFYLLASLAYLNFATTRKPRWYALATLLFFLALGAKTATVTLPAALLVVLWWRQGNLHWRRDIVPLLPWFAIAAAAGLLTVHVESNLVGAEGAPFELSLLHRTLLAGRIIWFYLGKLVWPVELIFYYPRWDVPAMAAQWWGYLAGIGAVTASLWFLRKKFRGPLAAWLLFVGVLFPVLGFFNVFGFLFSQVADHFQYMGIPVFIVTVATGVATLLVRLPPWGRVTGWVVCGAVMVLLAVQTHRQSRLYLNNETLFGDTVARNPESWMAYQILGTTLAKAKADPLVVIEKFQHVVRLKPDHPDAYVGIAVELAKLPGRSAEAIALHEKALVLRPNYVEAHNNLGAELAKLPGRQSDAITHYTEALRLQPNFAEAHLNLAKALTSQPGRMPEALTHFEAALRLQPASADAHYQFANALAGLPGRMTEALAHYETALQFDPALTGAHANLAYRLAQIPGRETDALAHAEEAVRLSPQSAEAHNTLAIIHARQGHLEQAREHWTAALQLNPNYETARRNLRLLDEMTKR